MTITDKITAFIKRSNAKSFLAILSSEDKASFVKESSAPSPLLDEPILEHHYEDRIIYVVPSRDHQSAILELINPTLL